MTRRRRKNRFLNRSPKKEEMSLQITAMADIFTVLLVFLLKSFSTGLTQITPTAAVLLPEAQAKDTVETVLKLEISPDVILLDDRPVVSLKNFKFSRNDLESDGTPRPLNIAFIRERSKPDSNPEESLHKVMLLADQKTPYATLKLILDSAANHGYSDFKLVVVEDQ